MFLYTCMSGAVWLLWTQAVLLLDFEVCCSEIRPRSWWWLQQAACCWCGSITLNTAGYRLARNNKSQTSWCSLLQLSQILLLFSCGYSQSDCGCLFPSCPPTGRPQVSAAIEVSLETAFAFMQTCKASCFTTGIFSSPLPLVSCLRPLPLLPVAHKSARPCLLCCLLFSPQHYHQRSLLLQTGWSRYDALSATCHLLTYDLLYVWVLSGLLVYLHDYLVFIASLPLCLLPTIQY